MPTRRTSPRRAMTRPTVPVGYDVIDHVDTTDDRLSSAAPWLALVALAVATAAIVLGFLNRGSDLSACRSQAWAAIPQAEDLPENWTLGSSDLNANGMTVSIMGPPSTDDTSSQPVVYASVTCYGDVAATAMTENRKAAKAAGSTVIERASADDAYDVQNQSSGSTTLFRVGPLIGQIADAGSASPDDLATITTAVATAMGNPTAAGEAGPPPSDAAEGSQVPGASVGSPEPEASSVAPDLEAKLPADLGGTPLTKTSATADQIFGTDPNSRALSARIRSLGSDVSDLQVAQAYDDTGTVDVSIVAFRLPGKDGAKLRDAIIETWLSANVAGVTKTEVTLGGKKLTKIDYHDDGPIDYVYGTSDYVIVIDTSDPAIATEAASKIK
jgi:hypothetical protein